MNTERIRQDRLDRIIAEDAADPANGPDCQTPHEVAMLAREVGEARKGTRTREHALRNALVPFAALTEAVRVLDHRGILDLSGLPLLRRQVEDCHRLLGEMNDRPAASAGPEATFTFEARP
jgi:hypothetical protein